MYVFYFFQYMNNIYFAMQIYTKKSTQHAKMMFFLSTASLASASKNASHPPNKPCLLSTCSLNNLIIRGGNKGAHLGVHPL